MSVSVRKLTAFIAAWLAVVVGAVMVVRGVETPVAATREIELGDLPLLFVDDSTLKTSTGVTRTIHPAHTRDAPVIEPDQPWERDRIYIYGSVYADPATGELRMWYMTRQPQASTSARDRVGSSPDLRGSGFDSTLYATSHDGLTWTKPALKLHAFHGSLDNNIVFDLHSPSVLIDPFEKDPARKYKMLGGFHGGYYAAHSADGLKWLSDPDPRVINASDTITLCQDPVTGEYLAYHKRPTKVRGFTRRVVWLSRSRDFQHWSDGELVFSPDVEDDAWATEPHQRTEIYDMAVYPYAGGFIGLPTVFHVVKESNRATLLPGQSGSDGPIDVQLASSTDGRTWRRTTPRTNIIPRGGPGKFDTGAILGVSSTPVNVGDETWVYYTGITTTHGAPIPPKRLSIGRAEWRRDGFVSLDAGAEGGTLTTNPLRLKSPALMVNADAAHGEVCVGLLESDGKPIDGFSLADAEPMKENATRWLARWKGNTRPPTDRPIQVQVQFENASLFSICTQP